VIAWYDPGLQVPSDPPRRASYRALQSWYRETVLGVEPGWHPSGRLLGSLLPKPRELDGLNFLDAQIAGYAKRRAWQVQQDGGTLEVGRLRRNMLSSMPLCFNLFGKLHAERSAAAKALSAVLGLDIADIDEVLVEHAPPAAKQLLGDRTAFDAFLTYTTATGAKGFVGVETKYTEPFSRVRYPASRYQHNPAYRLAGFHRDAADRLARPVTNQLWRNALLAAATRETGGYQLGHAVVIAGQDDHTAQRAVAAVSAELDQPDALLRWVSLERLIEHCQLQPSLAGWAAEFRRRYLDLAPVAKYRLTAKMQLATE
jgi:hypothetical protein